MTWIKVELIKFTPLEFTINSSNLYPLYLPRSKWTINQTLIFFKIRSVFRNYRDWSCTYQDRNEQSSKISLQNTKCVQKYRDCSLIYKGLNIEWNAYFPQNSLIVIYRFLVAFHVLICCSLDRISTLETRKVPKQSILPLYNKDFGNNCCSKNTIHQKCWELLLIFLYITIY